ncbi:Brp/Blh family beta-carotene 15,15'-dioxygenase [bacterium]|nr:Brp/Blh family beta-carotene 15,15'-dioxygenase [bacterium]
MSNFALDWIDYISLFLIIFVGIPHGAFDGAISVTLGFTKNFYLQLRFIIIYLLVAFGVMILWYFFPVLTLFLFLLTSIFHFGCGDLSWEKDNLYYFRGYAHGGLVVLGIIFFNQDDVESLFTILSGDYSSILWQFLHIALFIWLLSILILLLNFKKIKVCKYYIKLLTLIIIMIIIFPPLLAFAMYFCFIHSIHHIKRILPKLINFMEKKKIFYLVIIFSFISWLGGGIAFYIISSLNTHTEAIVKVTFIGLAALTFPHMILVDGIFRSKFKV